MSQSPDISLKQKDNNWHLSQTLNNQELDICFNVYSWQRFIVEQNEQEGVIQFFPFFSSPKLLNW